MNPIEVASADFGSGFDAIRTELLGPNSKLVLLENDGINIPFHELRRVVSQWTANFSERAGSVSFFVADLSIEFADAIRQGCSFMVVLDSTLVATNNLLHKVTGGTISPNIGSPFWRIEVETVGRLYDPPTSEE